MINRPLSLSLRSFARAVSQAASVISQTPDQVFPQVYNRLRSDASENKSLNKTLELAAKQQQKPWLRLISKYQPNTLLLRKLEGHNSGVTACAFSPDGEMIVSATQGGLALWNTATGQMLATLVGYSDRDDVCACVFSPDGTRIVSVHNALLAVWDVDTRTGIKLLHGHKDAVWDCAFSPDGKMIASAGEDGTVKLWDADWPASKSYEVRDIFTRFAVDSDDKPAVPIAELVHGGRVRACAFSPDGKQIVAANGGSVKVWDSTTLQELTSLRHRHPDLALQQQSDSRSEVEEDQGTAEAGLDIVSVLTFNNDGTRLLSGGVSCGQPRLWNTGDWTEIPFPQSLLNDSPALSNRTGLSFSPDGNFIASGGIDHQLRIWDIETGLTLASFKAHRHRVTDCCWSPDSTKILSASEDGTLGLWAADMASLAAAENLKANHEGPIYSCAWSTDGSRVVSGSFDGMVKLWDVSSRRDIVRLKHSSDYPVKCCAVSPNGHVIASGGGDGILNVWDVESEEKLSSHMAHAGGVACCAFTPNGKRIASGGWDGLLKLWDWETHVDVSILDGHTSTVRSCSFSSDGSLIATAGGTTVRVWDVVSGQPTAILKGHRVNVLSCALSPDGTRVVSSSEAGFLKLWDIAAECEIATRHEHREHVSACSFSPDGKRIISAGWADELVLWDVEGLKPIAILKDITGGLNTCAFGPDGKTIVCGGTNGYLLFFVVEEHKSSSVSEAVIAGGGRPAAATAKAVQEWRGLDVDPALIKLVPGFVCRKYCTIPLHKSGDTLTVATADVSNLAALDDITFSSGLNVAMVSEDKSVIEEAIVHFYGESDTFA